jgi:hypothetical protein
MLSTPVLFGPGCMPGENSFVHDGQANEQWSGYGFFLSGCDGTPASKYRVIAVPVDSDGEMKMFCADDSGSAKAVSRPGSSPCFSRGRNK